MDSKARSMFLNYEDFSEDEKKEFWSSTIRGCSNDVRTFITDKLLTDESQTYTVDINGKMYSKVESDYFPLRQNQDHNSSVSRENSDGKMQLTQESDDGVKTAKSAVTFSVKEEKVKLERSLHPEYTRRKYVLEKRYRIEEKGGISDEVWEDADIEETFWLSYKILLENETIKAELNADVKTLKIAFGINSKTKHPCIYCFDVFKDRKAMLDRIKPAVRALVQRSQSQIARYVLQCDKQHSDNISLYIENTDEVKDTEVLICSSFYKINRLNRRQIIELVGLPKSIANVLFLVYRMFIEHGKIDIFNVDDNSRVEIYKVVLNQKHSRLYRKLEFDSKLKMRFNETHFHQELEDHNVYVLGPKSEADVAHDVLSSGAWLNMVNQRVCKVNPLCIDLLQTPETKEYLKNKLQSHEEIYDWICTEDSVVVYADTVSLAANIAHVIEQCFAEQTIEVRITETGLKFINSADWTKKRDQILDECMGKLHIGVSEKLKDFIVIVFVCTSDVIDSVKKFITDITLSLSDPVVENFQPFQKQSISNTVELELLQYEYLCEFIMDAIEETARVEDVEVTPVNYSSSPGFIVKGDCDGSVKKVSEFLSLQAQRVKRMKYTVKDRVLILTLQNRDNSFLREISKKHNCFVSVNESIDTNPLACEVESDYDAVKGRWLLNNGCEIRLLQKEPDLCEVDVIVELEKSEKSSAGGIHFSGEQGLLGQTIAKLAFSKIGGQIERLNDLFLSAVSMEHRSIAFWVQNPSDCSCKMLTGCILHCVNEFSHTSAEVKEFSHTSAEMPFQKVYLCCLDLHACQEVREVVRDTNIKDVFVIDQHQSYEESESGNIHIVVVDGELSKQQVDVIVNTTSNTLDLDNGAVSKSILSAAGEEMQKELYRNYPNGVKCGDIAITNALALNCQRVFHGSLFSWANSGQEQEKCIQERTLTIVENVDNRTNNLQILILETKVLQSFVDKCLNAADKERFKSLAFPVLGTGNLKIPVSVAADTMIKTIRSYGRTNSASNISIVKIVVFQDNRIFKQIDSLVKNLENKSKPISMDVIGRCISTRHRKVSSLPKYPKEINIEIIGQDGALTDVIREIEALQKPYLKSSPNDKVQEKSAGQENNGIPKSAEPDVEERFPLQESTNENAIQLCNLVRTEDVSRCLLAVDLPKVENLAYFIDREMQSKGVIAKHVVYPYGGDRQALVIFDSHRDAECVMQRKNNNDSFDLKYNSANVLCNTTAHVDREYLYKMSSEKRNQLRLALINRCGVTVTEIEDGSTWVISGLLPQIEIAFEFFQTYDQDHSPGCYSIESKNSETSILTKTISGVSFEEYVALPFFFPDIDKLFQTDGEGMHYNSTAGSLCLKGSERHIDEVVNDLKQKLTQLRALQREYVSFESNDLDIRFVQEELCRLYPQVFSHICIMEDGNNYIALIAEDLDMLDKAKQDSLSIIDNAKEQHKLRFQNVSAGIISEKSNMAKYFPGQSLSFTGEDCFNTREGVMIYVYKGNILNLPVQCIVNAANEKLNHGGGIAEVISKASGSKINSQSKALIKQHGELSVGKACYTSAGKLKYDCVIHAVGPRWSNYNIKKEMEKERCAADLARAIESSIVTADTLKMKSIGIPPVSAGVFGVPKGICVKSYAIGIIQADSRIKGDNRTLKEIHFIDKDEEMVKQIQDTFREYFERPDTRSTESKMALDTESLDKQKMRAKPFLEKDAHFGSLFRPIHYEENTAGTSVHAFQLTEKLRVCTYTADLVSAKVETLVCGQDIKVQGKGAVAESIKALAGSEYAKKISQVKKEKSEFQLGEVFIVPGGVLTPYVCHAITPKWKKQKNFSVQMYMAGIRKCFSNVLMQAAQLGIHTIAMPLLGTGTEGVPVEKVASILLDQVLSFIYDFGPKCPLTEIHMVNKKEDVTNILISLFKDHVESEWNRMDADEKKAKGKSTSGFVQETIDQSSHLEKNIAVGMSRSIPNKCTLCWDPVSSQPKFQCDHYYCDSCITHENILMKNECPACEKITKGCI